MLGFYRLIIFVAGFGLWASSLMIVCVVQAHGQSSQSGVLAFVSDRDGQRDIFLIDVNHTITLNLTQDRIFDDAPAWSPDGRLAFESYRNRGAAIIVMDTVTLETEQVTNNAGSYMPAWSPTGQLAYVAQRGANLEIILLEISTGEARDVSGHPGDEFNPAWSPDGRLAFDSFNEEQITGEIFIRNTETGSGRGVLDSGHYYDPAWSPDGQMAVVSSLSGSADIYLMDPTTGEVVAIVNTPAGETQPAWSHNGMLAYVVGYHDGVGEIYVKDLSTGETRNLTRNNFNDYSPAWMP